MKGLSINFFSHNDIFYESFNDAVENLVMMAEALRAITDTALLAQKETLHRHIGASEKTVDDITHKVFLTLDKVMFPPFNRKDIYTLVTALNVVADSIKEASGRLHCYNIVACTPLMKEMALNILKSTIAIKKILVILPKAKSPESVLDLSKSVKRYAILNEKIYFESLARLFDCETDAINIVKHSDILTSLESATKKCKKVDEAIEMILINNI